MNRKHLVLTAAIAALLAAPVGASTWRAEGSSEPDTSWDQTDGRMFTQPDQEPGPSKVYFNGYQTTYVTGVNPNPATTDGRLMSTGTVHYRAMLGIWKDCNKDGYVGLAESAVTDYRVELGLHDATVCPLQARSEDGPPVHNNGKWIREFLYVGMVDPCEFEPAAYRSKHCGGMSGFTKNPDVVYVNGTRLWADLGAPGDEPGTSCPVRPVPQGTTAGTGGFLYFADCITGRKVATSVNDVSTLVDPDNNLGLRFDDPYHPQHSDSVLNQHFPVNLFGNPYNGKSGLLQRFDPYRSWYDPAFSVQDCSVQRTDVRDPTAEPGENGSLNQVGVKAPEGTPESLQTNQDYLVASVNLTDNQGVILGVYGYKAPSGVNPTGSYWAALEDANDAVYYGPYYQSGTAGDCDRKTNNTAHQQYPFTLIEDDHEPNSEAGKLAPSVHFTFFDGARGIVGDEEDETLGYGKDFPIDAGVGVNRELLGGPAWSANAVYVASQQIINRDTFEPAGRLYRTFYADVNVTGLGVLGYTLPTTVAGKYGSENCVSGIGPGKGVENGWVCDPTLWHTDSTGKDIRPRYADTNPDKEPVYLSALVGDPYELRDVDCYDGHVFGGAVYASPAQISPEGTCGGL